MSVDVEQIDAEVAVRVMGWKRDDPDYDGPEPLFLAPNGGSRFLSELPRYSTDIGAAWAVVERMRELDYALAIEDYRRYGADEWRVEFTALGPSSRQDAWVYVQSLPLAIVRAALAALAAQAGGEGDEDA